MADTKNMTAAELQSAADAAASREWLLAARSRQLARIEAYNAKVKVMQGKVDDALARLAKIESDIASGKLINFPKKGGVVVNTLPGTLGVKGV